jgi:hypothetical protein
MFLHNLKKKMLVVLTPKIPLGEKNPAALAEWHRCFDKSDKFMILLLLLLFCAYSVKTASQKFSSSQQAYSFISRSLNHVLQKQIRGKLLWNRNKAEEISPIST